MRHSYVEDASLASSSNLTDEPVVPGSALPPTNALVALVEQGLGGLAVDDRVRIGLVSVVPGTGEVVWDEFDGRSESEYMRCDLADQVADSQVRTELETRLTHLQPAELLLPASGLSKATEKVLNHFAGNTKCGNPFVSRLRADTSRTSASSSVRVERIEKILAYDAAFDYLTRFYRRETRSTKISAKPKLGHRASEEIDLTALSDEEGEYGKRGLETGEDGQQKDASERDGADPIDLAAGLPGERGHLSTHLSRTNLIRSRRSGTGSGRLSKADHGGAGGRRQVHEGCV